MRLKAEEIIAKLYAVISKRSEIDLDVNNSAVKKVKEAFILDNIEVKTWVIKLAVDAVFSFLHVNQVIIAKPTLRPKPKETLTPDF